MEALRSGLHEQKENVEASITRGKLTYDELPGKTHAPSARFHPYSTPKSSKVKDKQSGSIAKKPRRALGDISNQHRTPTDGNKAGGSITKRPSESKPKLSLKSSETASAKKPSKAAVVTSTPKRITTTHGDSDDIEFAYGGLPPLGPDPDYLERIRQEIVNEIYDDRTPSVLDDYERSDRSKQTTSSDAPWWSIEPAIDTSITETTAWSDDSIASTLDLNAPEPEEFSDPLEEQDDCLLEELLNVDIPVNVDGEDDVKDDEVIAADKA